MEEQFQEKLRKNGVLYSAYYDIANSIVYIDIAKQRISDKRPKRVNNSSLSKHFELAESESCLVLYLESEKTFLFLVTVRSILSET